MYIDTLDNTKKKTEGGETIDDRGTELHRLLDYILHQKGVLKADEIGDLPDGEHETISNRRYDLEESENRVDSEIGSIPSK